MPTFRFKATDTKGNLITDTITSSSETEAETLLKDKKLKVLVLEEKKNKISILPSLGKSSFPTREKISFCRNLSLLISAGVPMADGFDLLISNTGNTTVKKTLQEIAFSLRKGESISRNIARYPQYFGDVFLVMVKTGEASGTLSQSLNYLAKEFKQENDLKQKVISSLLYPAIILALMCGVGLLMMTFVLPRLAKVFLSLKVALPLPTKMLLTASLFLEKNLPLVFLFLILIVLSLYLFAKSKTGHLLAYWLGINLPVLKNLLSSYNLARFTQILATLITSGVPITQALELSVRSLVVAQKEEFYKRIQGKITRGVPLSTIFKEERVFPPMVSQIVSVGEKTGNLDKLLADLSTFYQEEVENSLKNFVTVLEPVLMIIVGIAVGLMVISVITPIYSIIGKLQVK
jgi:type IV pilus assembly protein PilC